MRNQRWIVDVLTFLMFGFLLFELIKTAVLMPTIAKQLHLTLVQVGLLLGIFSGGPGIIMGIVGGTIVDKIGARWAGVFPLIAFTAVTVGIGLSTTYSEIAIALIVFGTFDAFVNSITYKLTGNWFGNKERGLGAGVTNSASPFFTFLAPAVAIPLLLFFHNNFRDVFLVFAAAALPLVILWFIFVYDKPEESPLIEFEELKKIYADELKEGIFTEDDLKKAAETKKPISRIVPGLIDAKSTSTKEAFTTIFKSGRGWGLILGIAVMNLIWASYSEVLPTYFTDFMKYSTSIVGLFTSLTYFAGFVAAILSGVLAFRYKKLTLMKIGVVISLVATIPLMIVGPGTSSVLMLTITSIGFFAIIFYFPPFYSYTAQYFGRAVLGRVLGIQFSFIALALAFGPTIMLDIASGPGWHFSYLFVTVMVVVAIILTFIVRDKNVSSEKGSVLIIKQ
ncbi:MAG: MFS transporter [Candidatus Nanoarchaeia archaeon]|nr:MFS transporter [Candidatus Jingweiarchaeum tengchongense]